MNYNKYIVLISSIYYLYFIIIKYKENQNLKIAGIMASVGGIITAISMILEDEFGLSRSRIGKFTEIPLYVVVFIMLLMITIYAYNNRKNPKEKLKVYSYFGFLIFSTIVIIVVFWILPLLGI